MHAPPPLPVHIAPPPVRIGIPGYANHQGPALRMGNTAPPPPVHVAPLPVHIGIPGYANHQGPALGMGNAAYGAYPFPYYYPMQPVQPPPNPVRTLPTLTHIPLLNSRLDFAPWDSGIRSVLRSLGLIGHIAVTGDPIDPLRPETMPSHPPNLTQGYDQAALMAYRQWWDRDAIADHVISTRLSNLVRASLPPDNILGTGTARAVYEAIRQLYGLRGLADGLAIYNALMSLPCNPHHVQDFVIKWRAGVSRLHECQYPISSRLMIQQFVSRLPADAPAFFTLRAALVSRLQGIADNDFTAFISLTQEVIDLDNTFRQSQPARPSNNRNNRGQGGPPRAPNAGQQQQQQASSSQQPPPPTNPAPIPSSGQPRRDGGQASNSGGRAGNRRNDYSNRDHRNDNQTFLATLLPEPTTATPGTQDQDSSANTPEPIAFLAALDSTPIVNDDVQADLYDPFGSLGFAAMALSPELSNALALIATSPDPSARLNTVLDSGSTHHIFRDRSAFFTYKVAQELSVKTANCGSLMAMGMGSVKMVIHLSGRKVELMLQNCLHAPEVPINLFSVGDLQENGFRIHFEPGTTSPSFAR